MSITSFFKSAKPSKRIAPAAAVENSRRERSASAPGLPGGLDGRLDDIRLNSSEAAPRPSATSAGRRARARSTEYYDDRDEYDDVDAAQSDMRRPQQVSSRRSPQVQSTGVEAMPPLLPTPPPQSVEEAQRASVARASDKRRGRPVLKRTYTVAREIALGVPKGGWDSAAHREQCSSKQMIAGIATLLSFMTTEAFEPSTTTYDFSSPTPLAGEEINRLVYWKYITSLDKICMWTPEVTVYGLVLLIRLLTYHPTITLHLGNWQRLVLLSMMIAQKAWDDLSLSNVEFVKVSQLTSSDLLTLRDINFMELQYLHLLNWDVHVSARSYFSTLMECCTLVPELSPYSEISEKSNTETESFGPLAPGSPDSGDDTKWRMHSVSKTWGRSYGYVASSVISNKSRTLGHVTETNADFTHLQYLSVHSGPSTVQVSRQFIPKRRLSIEVLQRTNVPSLLGSNEVEILQQRKRSGSQCFF